MVEAKRARTAETPKPPSFDLRSRAPYFYPTTQPKLWRRAKKRLDKPLPYLRYIKAVLAAGVIQCG
ncbi:MAG TPA: hypothetical protein VE844_15990, partial [Gammaproteobacteria bacterium]|nr:hypothetical protein [Gammaproteobacteria bacterium]